MAIRMGYWDCPGCSQKRIEGPERQCPGCGAPRNDDVEFYTDDDAPEVTDTALLQRARSGADWQCPFCSSDNPAGTVGCVSCGASDPTARQREVRYIPDQPEARPHDTPVPGRKRGPLGAVVVAAVLVLVAVLIWVLFLRSRPLEVEVKSVTWTKTLQTEELRSETGSAWLGEVPAGASEVSRTTRLHKKRVQEGTRKVKVGKKDLGNGMFEDVYEEQPNFIDREVEDTWITYKIDRWAQGQKLKEERSDGSEPPEPSFTPGAGQRAGPRASFVALNLEGQGKAYSYNFQVGDDARRRERARGFKVGQIYTAMVTAVGAIRELR